MARPPARHGGRAEGIAVINISAAGTTRKLSHDLRNDERRVANILMLAVDEGARAAQAILRAEAPERTGRLKRNIQITRFNRSKRRPSATITVLPPRTGPAGPGRSQVPFNYLPVTRFGRREVASTRHMVQMRHPATGRPVFRRTRFGPIRIRSATALRFTPMGAHAPIMRRRVKAWRPAEGDWVRRAEDRIRPEVEAIIELANRQILAALRSGRSLRTGGMTVKRANRLGRFD